ncbi:putative inactive tyrosine-protein kinase Wsck [Toxorhynchites rutilus septentrionalis]|uniref:putative inactive tyrosine-protein kinase Wsck n=1 Tax=Toxorhynchites rutilus septentrionalis TaxID=329112 RepID=UPI002479FE88|nr:putative inactive tyrosine-protein kinase Wsck [Toxorhynchites rutilus septentrionalis]
MYEKTNTSFKLQFVKATGAVIWIILFACGQAESQKGFFLGCYQLDRSGRFETVTDDLDACVSDCERHFYRYAALSDTQCACLNVIRTNVIEDIGCNIKCRQNVDQTCGGSNAQSFYATGVENAGPVNNLKVLEAKMESTIKISWDPPAHDGVPVKEYEISARNIFTFANYQLHPLSWIVNNHSHTFELSNLTPGTRFNITVTTIAGKGRGGTSSLVAETEIGIPDPEPEEPLVLRRLDSTIQIEIPKAINNNGPINFYRVVVHYVNDDLVQEFDESLLDTYQRSKEKSIPYYIAAEVEMKGESLMFIVGDGQYYRNFFNAPIPHREHVHISTGVVSVLNNVVKIRYTTTTHEQRQHPDFNHVNSTNVPERNEVLVTVLTVACVLFGIVLLASIILYIYLRYKTPENTRPLSDHHEMALQGPILEVENNGYMPDVYEQRGFEAELHDIIDSLESHKKHGRKYLNLDINNIVGSGKYGDVLKGSLQWEGVDLPAHVHVISDDMDKPDQISFLNEFRKITLLDSHPNVLDFFGICMTPDWCYVLFEDMQTTLKQMLLNARVPESVNCVKFSTISEEVIINILCHVCDGMQYLLENNVVNRKLCARTVYVNTKFDVKVSAFGSPLYGEGSQQIDIARWNAPEVMKFQNHTMKSDIWSFGLLIWECCCLGATPFGTTTTDNLFASIRAGNRPGKPSFVYDDLYQVCLNCWDLDANDRPAFEDISRYLRQTLPMLRYMLSFERDKNVEIPPYLPHLELMNL